MTRFLALLALLAPACDTAAPTTRTHPDQVLADPPALVSPTPASRDTLFVPVPSSPAASSTERPIDPAGDASAAKELYYRGVQSLELGTLAVAIDFFKRCLAADANYCLCYRALGIANAKANDSLGAYRAYQQYVQRCPTSADATKVQELLRQFEQTR